MATEIERKYLRPFGHSLHLFNDFNVMAPRYRRQKFLSSLFKKPTGTVFREKKLPHQPQVVRGESLQPWKRRPQIGGQPLDNRLSPTQVLLLLHDPTPDVPVELNQLKSLYLIRAAALTLGLPWRGVYVAPLHSARPWPREWSRRRPRSRTQGILKHFLPPPFFTI